MKKSYIYHMFSMAFMRFCFNCVQKEVVRPVSVLKWVDTKRQGATGKGLEDVLDLLLNIS